MVQRWVRGHGAEMGQGPWCGDASGAMVRIYASGAMVRRWARDHGAEMGQGPWCGDASGAMVWRCVRGHGAEMGH